MVSRKHRRQAAMRAAKRLPLVGTTVAILPAVEALADAGVNSGNFASVQTWRQVGKNLILRYTGVNLDSKGVEGDKLVTTYAPIIVYAIAQRTRISRPISRALGRMGLRF